jgi:hypothetical protein
MNMTLSFNCVSQNWPDCADLTVGNTMYVDDVKAYSGTRRVVLEITRLTNEYCKVKERRDLTF